MYSNGGINKVFLVGIVESTPKWHKSLNEQDSLNFTLTTKEIILKNKVNTEHMEWHHIKVAVDLPDIDGIELKKGQMLHITGKIKTKAIIDEQQIKRYKTEINVVQLQVLSASVTPVHESV